MSNEYDSKRHAESLQYILNVVVGFIDAARLQEIIDYYVDSEADVPTIFSEWSKTLASPITVPVVA